MESKWLKIGTAVKSYTFKDERWLFSFPSFRNKFMALTTAVKRTKNIATATAQPKIWQKGRDKKGEIYEQLSIDYGVTTVPLAQPWLF